MNKIIVILIFNLLVLNSFSQNDSSFFIDDIRVSLNVSSSENGDIRDQLGLGIGVYHTFMPNKKFNTLLGLGFDKSFQVLNYMYEDEYTYTSDLKFDITTLSLHALSRYSVGKRTKAFIEAGVYFEYIISVYKEGIQHSYSIDNDKILTQFRQHYYPSSFSYGVTAGMGMMFPFLENYLIIKPEYRLGSNIPIGLMDNVPNRYFRFVIGLKF